MKLKLNGQEMPAKFTKKTIDQFGWMFQQIIENDKLGIIDDKMGPSMVVLVTRLLEEGARSKINWRDVYGWMNDSYDSGTWNENLKEILKNFYYFQNEN